MLYPGGTPTRPVVVWARRGPANVPGHRTDKLVDYFGGGNRSAYLRATLKVMESLRRAERLRELQAANHRRLAEQGVQAEALPDLIRDAYMAAGG